MKFKVGDRVIAQRGAPYSITTNGWRGRVVNISQDVGANIFVKGRNGEGYWVAAQYFDLLDEKEGESKMDVSNIITEEERETLLDQMENLLDEYDYEYTNRALNKIIDTWANNKKDPYYSKYRYLQQYNNRQLNKQRRRMADSSLQPLSVR